MNPPNIVDIELTPQEVHEDLVKVVESMNKIRFESINNKQVSEKQKEEYLHLTYRLASCIEAIASEEIVDLMQKSIDIMNTQKDLINYDPLQDGYWNKNEKTKEFSQRLEVILMSLINEQFQFVEDKHHILQAIKYLAVRNGEEKDIEEVCGTILPFQKAIGFETQQKTGFFEKLLGRLLGEDYSIERKDALTLVDEGVGDFIDALIVEAAERGFTTINYRMFYRNYKPLENKLKGFVKDTTQCEIVNWHGRKIASDSLVSLEIPLRPQVKPSKQINCSEIYEKIIRSEVLPEIVASYPFLKAGNFSDEGVKILESLGINGENYKQFKVFLDQTLKGHAIHHESKINQKQINFLGLEMEVSDYNKLHSLLLTKEESFIVYAVIQDQPIQYQDQVSRTILLAKSLDEKAQLLGLQLNAAHILIKKYIKGTEVDCGEYLQGGGVLK